MLRSLKILDGYNILARDGELGKVEDILFDDSSWSVRYLVINTEGWLSGRRLLLSSGAVKHPDWASQKIPVELTRKQVEKSPPLEEDAPVSRQYEESLFEYFGWMPYWAHGGVQEHAVHEPVPVEEEASQQAPSGSGPRKTDTEGNPNLRSVNEVTGYNIGAKDGEIGELDDLIVDDKLWRIKHMIVDTGKWLPGKKVILPIEMAEKIEWEKTRFDVDAGREKIKNAPEFKPDETVNKKYEEILYDYYGRPHYRGQSMN